jgi:hypothetical protein
VFANGHKLVMDMALDALDGEGAPLREHYDPLLLGNLREDVYKFPFVVRFMLGKGLTHYYRPGRRWGVFPLVPGAPMRSDWLFDAGVRLYRAGDRRAGVFNLGRVVHLLSEMAAPVHAQIVLHWRGDPMEMYVERNAPALRALPVPPAPPEAERARSAGELVHDLAVHCQRFPCDRTTNTQGYLAYRLGLRRRHTEEEAAGQARALIPVGAAYTAALYRLFLRRAAA